MLSKLRTIGALLVLGGGTALAQNATAVWDALPRPAPANFTYDRSSAKSIRLVEQAPKGERANFPLMTGRVFWRSRRTLQRLRFLAYYDWDLNINRCSDYDPAASSGAGWIARAPAKLYADLTGRFGPANNNILMDMMLGNRMGTWDLCRQLRMSRWGASARAIVGAGVPWMEEAYKIIADADRNFVDIVSLTQPDLTEGFQPYMNVVARAIAENVLIKRVDENLDMRHGAVRLDVRMAFSQRFQEDSTESFRGDAVQDLAPRWGKSLRDQLGIIYRRLYGGAIPTGPGTGAKLNNAVQLGILHAYWERGRGVLNSDWNHSKIISNGVKALVGGSNMYNDYMWQNDGTGVVYDTDLVLEGTPAKFASQWVDTLWRDYRPPRVRQGDTARVTWTDSGHQAANMGDSVRDFLNFGERVALTPGESGPSDGPTVVGVGQRGWDFAPNPYTVDQINAYDSAIAALIQSADDAPDTWIGIVQQDLLNALETADLSEGPSLFVPLPRTRQRFALADRIAREIGKPAAQQHLRVYMIKSSDTSSCVGGRKGGMACSDDAECPDGKCERGPYNRYPLYRSIHILYANVQQRLRARFPQQMGAARRPAGWSDEAIRTEFCNIIRAAKWMRGRGPILTAQDLDTNVARNPGGNWFRGRAHSKLVFVKGASGSAVSVGSLNFYDALMMHDYGNIVFDNGASGSLTDQVRRRFEEDWRNAEYPKEQRSNTDERWGRRICSWQYVKETGN